MANEIKEIKEIPKNVVFNIITASDSGFDKEIDPYIQGIVRMANTGMANLPVVLHIGGTSVYGTTISMRDYFNGVADDILETTKSEILKEIFSGEDFEINPTDDINFIHLKDVLIDSQAQRKLKFWRGKLRNVDGFSLISLERE
jgi:hypothetical protein